VCDIKKGRQATATAFATEITEITENGERRKFCYGDGNGDDNGNDYGEITEDGERLRYWWSCGLNGVMTAGSVMYFDTFNSTK